ncbi:MAG: hypothetical protein EBY25_01410 [Betaproteobacteria bacterium]|nr:hypothetical protein [Betaproteobacteria bacterium]
MALYSRITGTGSCLPPQRLSNADLVSKLAAQGVETSDDWIVERTGIRARHFADDGVFSSDLGLVACRAALQAAGLQASDIDLIIVATSTPDMVFPSTACILQHKLGANGGAAFDVQAVCSGFIYALAVADAMLKTGAARKLKLPMEKVIVTVDQHGNTSAASIPLALDHGIRSGRVKPGQTLMLEGVGGGLAWGAVLLDL